MDIPEVSMALANASVLSQVGTAVLSKALDSSKELAAGMAQLMDAAAMELAVNPNVGANFDMRVCNGCKKAAPVLEICLSNCLGSCFRQFFCEKS